MDMFHEQVRSNEVCIWLSIGRRLSLLFVEVIDVSEVSKQSGLFSLQLLGSRGALNSRNIFLELQNISLYQSIAYPSKHTQFSCYQCRHIMQEYLNAVAQLFHIVPLSAG